MSLNLSNLVSLTIAVEDFSPKVSDFGAMAIFGKHSNSPTPLTYAANADGLAQMVTDGFATTDALYVAVSAAASQTPAVETVKIYNRSGDATPDEFEFTPTVTAEGRTTQLTINGTLISHTNGASETPTTIATELYDQIVAATSLPVTAVDNTGSFSLEVDAGKALTITNRSRSLTMLNNTTLASDVADIATALGEAAADDPDFYGFVIADTTNKTVQKAAADWAQANKRLFLGFVGDDETATAALNASGTDAGNVFAAAGYTYAGLFFGRNHDYPHVATMARQLSRSVGSSTWTNQQLVRTGNSLSEGESDTLDAKRVWAVVNYKGASNILRGGRGAGGRSFDITRGVDWLDANMTADVVTVLVNAEKIPYNDGGIGAIETAMRARLSLAVKTGFIEPGFTVTVPKLVDVPTGDKVARVLNNTTFGALASGAIETVSISGRLKV